MIQKIEVFFNNKVFDDLVAKLNEIIEKVNEHEVIEAPEEKPRRGRPPKH